MLKAELSIDIGDDGSVDLYLCDMWLEHLSTVELSNLTIWDVKLLFWTRMYYTLMNNCCILHLNKKWDIQFHTGCPSVAINRDTGERTTIGMSDCVKALMTGLKEPFTGIEEIDLETLKRQV